MNRYGLLLFFSGVFIFGLLYGCGSSPKVVSQNYFPLGQGDVWAYSLNIGTCCAVTYTETVTGHTIWEGQDSIEVDNSGGSCSVGSCSTVTDSFKQYYINEGGTVEFIGSQSTDETNVFSPSEEFLKASINVGDTWGNTFTVSSYGTTGTLITQYAMTVTITAVSLTETVSVPAGTFSNCLRVHKKFIWWLNPIEETDMDVWYAPSVGRIMLVEETEVIELLNYSISEHY